MNKIVNVKINGRCASGRTRTRVKHHGPLFEVFEPKMKKNIRPNQTLLKSVKGKWFGWLPDSEIIITEVITDWKNYGNNNPW